MNRVNGVRAVLTPRQMRKAATIPVGMNDLHGRMRQLLGKQGVV